MSHIEQAIGIITRNLSTEGFDYPRDVLLASVIEEVRTGGAHAFVYGQVAFTVGASQELPDVHVYSDGGACLLSAGSRFMRDVWDQTGHEFLVAPIINSKVMAFAERFGWSPVGLADSGHILYAVRRWT